MKPSVVYEDQDVLVLNKPSGLLVHPAAGTKESTLLEWLHKNYPEIKGVGETQRLSNGEIIERPGIVHRLDKETSGVIVVAKNQKAFEFLKQQFQSREIQKTYQALVWGEVKDDEGIINAPIARSKKDFRQWSAQRGRRGKEREAITEYKVLKRFTTPPTGHPSLIKEGMGGGNPFTFLEVYPKTGRTHQIRVHMKYINHPIVCDKLYAAKKPCPVLGLTRLALHAKSIEFTLPSGGKIKAEAPLPNDFPRDIV